MLRETILPEETPEPEEPAFIPARDCRFQQHSMIPGSGHNPTGRQKKQRNFDEMRLNPLTAENEEPKIRVMRQSTAYRVIETRVPLEGGGIGPRGPPGRAANARFLHIQPNPNHKKRCN
jgi:hypothetical protein